MIARGARYRAVHRHCTDAKKNTAGNEALCEIALSFFGVFAKLFLNAGSEPVHLLIYINKLADKRAESHRKYHNKHFYKSR